MASIDKVSEGRAFLGLAPAAYAAPTDGITIDLLGYESPILLLAVGVWTDGNYDVVIDESANGSDWTEIPYATGGSMPLIGDVANPATTIACVGGRIDADADENKVWRVGYRGVQRYVRCRVEEPSAATGGVVMSAVWFLMNVRHLNRV